MTTTTPPLPTVHEAHLDAETLLELLDDIEAHAQLIEVVARAPGARRASREALTLDAGRGLLLSGALRGLQLRYRYAGQEWFDTLLREPDGGMRLVRITHDDDPVESREEVR